MKTGFSTLVCPGWDLETAVSQAAALGFDGVELRGLKGELNLPMIPELTRHPQRVRDLLSEHKVELVSLGCSATLTARGPRAAAEQRAAITDYVELASRLGCPNVRIYVGDIDRGDDRYRCLPRLVEQLRAMTNLLSQTGVRLLIENGGDFPGSADLWFVLDGVGHPLVKAAWNQCNALSERERATTSLPRLGGKLGLVHICDATFDNLGVIQDYTPLGAGHAEVARQIEILKGLIYTGYLVFEWPKLWSDNLPSAEATLPAVAEFLKTHLEAKQPVLTAYKGDKNAPRLAALGTSSQEDGAK